MTAKYDYGESIQDRDRRRLRASIEAARLKANKAKQAKALKRRAAEEMLCWRSRHSEKRTRHVVRFFDDRLNVLRRTIQEQSKHHSLVDALRASGVDALCLDAIRQPHELDRELKRRIGYAFSCWEGVALVSLPDTKLRSHKR